jgi:hypothetical protein
MNPVKIDDIMQAVKAHLHEGTSTSQEVYVQITQTTQGLKRVLNNNERERSPRKTPSPRFKKTGNGVYIRQRK